MRCHSLYHFIELKNRLTYYVPIFEYVGSDHNPNAVKLKCAVNVLTHVKNSYLLSV